MIDKLEPNLAAIADMKLQREKAKTLYDKTGNIPLLSLFVISAGVCFWPGISQWSQADSNR
jgi:apolipoprotein N-acyltransferase